MKTKRYYNDRAKYMRQMADEAQTEKLRATCLKAADAYETLAEQAAKAEVKEPREE